MVVHEGQDLLEVEVLLLALYTQVVEGEMDDIHPAGAKGLRGSAAHPLPGRMVPTAMLRSTSTAPAQSPARLPQNLLPGSCDHSHTSWEEQPWPRHTLQRMSPWP